MNVPLKLLVANTVDGLAVTESAKGRNSHYLGLTAGKYRRTVGTWQDTDLAPNGTDLGVSASVGTDALVDYLITKDLLHEIIENIVDIGCGIGILLSKMLYGLSLYLRGALFALMSVEGIKLPFNLFTGILDNLCLKLLIGSMDNGDKLFLADLRLYLGYPGNDGLDVFMTKEDCVEHFLLGDLVCARFDHHDGVLGACHGEVQAAGFTLLGVGIDDIVAVNIANADRTDGACKRSLADRQRKGCTVHSKDVGLYVIFNAHAGRNDLNIIIESLGEKRTDRTVDKTAGKYSLFGGAAFALDEASRDLSGCIHLLFIITAQRQEIGSFPGLAGYGGAYEQGCIAAADEYRTACLLCILAGFSDNGPSGEL